MPDLMHPDFTEGKLRHIVWKDEKCISCLNQGSCAFIQSLYEHKLLTMSGIHVAHCALYKPDTSSEYYIDDPEDLAKIAEVNTAALTQQIEVLTDLLGKVIKEAGLEETSDQ